MLDQVIKITDAKMVVDTSALVAVVKREDGYLALARAMLGNVCLLPAPVILEFHCVTAGPRNVVNHDAIAFLEELLSEMGRVVSFDAPAALAAAAANAVYGKGNGSGVALNVVDLMVYGITKVSGLPILCTGRDFAATDAAIHPASRIG